MNRPLCLLLVTLTAASACGPEDDDRNRAGTSSGGFGGGIGNGATVGNGASSGGNVGGSSSSSSSAGGVPTSSTSAASSSSSTAVNVTSSSSTAAAASSSSSGGNVPALWNCPDNDYGDGWCDCGCGAPDSDCGGQGCFQPSCNAGACEICHDSGGIIIACGGGGATSSSSSSGGVPTTWTCQESYYGDADCDCGCGAADPACAGAGCTTLSCQAAACDYCNGPFGLNACEGSSSSSGGGPAAGEVGSTCAVAGDCNGGSCLDEAGKGWPGGYCSDLFCGDCGAGGHCGKSYWGVDYCYQSCTSNTQCRAGYECYDYDWDGVNECAPVGTGTSPIGGPCITAANCSGGQHAICLTDSDGYTDGFCTDVCSGTSACGSGTHCHLTSFPNYKQYCSRTCVDDFDCRSGYECRDRDGSGNTECEPP